MFADPDKTTPYITEILKEGPSSNLATGVLHRIVDVAQKHNGEKPLPKNVLHWILPIAKALGNDKNNAFNISSQEIEDFFACFPYPEVRSYLIDPLIHSVQRQGEKKFPREWVSVRVIKAKDESYCFQHTYRAHYKLLRPILTGLVRSLNAMGKHSGLSDVLDGDIVGDIETGSPNPIVLVPERGISDDEFLARMRILAQEVKVMIVTDSQSTSLKGEVHIGGKVIKGRLVLNLEQNGVANDQWGAFFICDDTDESMRLSDSSVETDLEALQMAIKNGFVSKVE
jgi:hypothetical protein